MPQEPQDDFAQYKRPASASGDDFSGYKRASSPQARSTGVTPPPTPGWLDREIPLTSYTNATLSGLQSLGKGVRGVVQGAAGMLDPRPQPGEAAMSGLMPAPVQRTLRGVYDLGRQALQVPGAVHDINASPDPVGHYAKAAQDMAGEGAAQALAGAAMEGVNRGGPYVRPVGEALGKAAYRKFIPREVRGVLRDVSAAQPVGAAPAPTTAIPGVDVPPSVGRLSEPSSALSRASEPPSPIKPDPQLQIPGVNARPSVERVAEPAIPGVNARPSIERLASADTSPLQRASEPPAPVKPSAEPIKPSVGRIQAESAKPVEPKPVTPTERASEVKAPAGVKPVVPSDEAVARMDRARAYRLGAHAGNPEADAYLTKTNQELVDEANARKIDGRDNWSVKDLKRTSSVHGKFLAPAKEDLIGKLLKPEGSGLPPKMPSADVGRQAPNVQVRLGAKGEDLSDIISHEANMRQRAAEAQAAREKLGPLGLRSQEPTQTPSPSPSAKVPRLYQKYGKLDR